MLNPRRFPFTLLVALNLVLAFAAVPSLAARRERKVESWKPTHYDVALTLDPQLKEIVTARTEIAITTVTDGVSTIDLDFGELTVDSVTVDGTSARFSRAPERLDVHLATPVAKGTRLKIGVTYRGKPKDGLILTNDKDGLPSAVGDNWPNRVHHWIPALDHPSAKATVSFSITAPENLLVVANGKFAGVTNAAAGTRTWSFTESVAIPPYCMILAAGQFAKITGDATVTPVEYFVPRSDAARAALGFGPTAPSLKLFTETIAPYPYEKLAMIVGATQFGGMENSSAIVFASNILNPNPNAPVSATFKIRKSLVELVAHEIAHQWFGDSVTEATWADLWLSEGFATYFAGIFVQRTDGEQDFRAYMKSAANAYLNYARRKRTPLHDTETEDLFALLNPNSYQKGSWVLHMLRSQLGDEAFFRGIREYYKVHQNSIATSEDLRTALEKSSGQDLRAFFDAWVYRAGHPHYEWSWKWNGEKKLLQVNVKQLQVEPAFPNWVPLDVITASGARRLLLKPTSKDHNQEFALDSAPTKVELDPDNTVLKEVTASAVATPKSHHTSVAEKVQKSPSLVGRLKDSRGFGCGCEFQLPQDKNAGNRNNVFISDLENSAWMNIDGHDVQLKFVRTIKAPDNANRPDRKGDMTVEEYWAAGAKIMLSLTVTRPCAPGDEDCEFTGMDAVITVTKGRRKRVVKAVGGCGC